MAPCEVFDDTKLGDNPPIALPPPAAAPPLPTPPLTGASSSLDEAILEGEDDTAVGVEDGSTFDRSIPPPSDEGSTRTTLPPAPSPPTPTPPPLTPPPPTVLLARLLREMVCRR